jgi:hypothetical protein
VENPDNFYAVSNGFKYSVGSEDNGFLGDFVEFDDVLEAVREWSEANGYFPELYFVSDHGNVDSNPTLY